MTSWIPTSNLPENPDEFCERLNYLLHEKQAGRSFDIIIEKNVAIADKLLEYRCISTRQHSFLTPKCSN